MERKSPVSSSGGSSSRRTISSSRTRTSRRRPGCIRLFVCPTTGGRLEISVSPKETVLGLKAALARKLRILPSKLTLIYKDKVLKDGCLLDYKIPDESHVTLLPNMESGLSLHQSDKSIMQALENLSETQVNDFLSGRAPLMLAIRKGEHMVFVQLQLTTLQSQAAAANIGHGQTNQSQQSSNVPASRPGAALTPGAATLLSQSGLSASALAQATRCLSQKLHRLQELNRNGASASQTVSSKTTLSGNSSSQSRPHNSSPLTPHVHPTGPPMSSTTAAPSPQTLMQLPTRPTLPMMPENPLPSPPPSPGAVIDSMKHVGKGVFTGTFSGTLDSSLQDGNGQPRRSVNTILHILNDLLVAAPQSPPATPEGRDQGPSGSQTFAFNTPNPVPAAATSSVTSESSDNEILRSKMQRIQMMLAQRKEQRRSRREMCSPYTTPKSLAHPISSSSWSSKVSSSSAPMCSAGSTVNSTSGNPAAPVTTHSEPSGDASYCKTSIEQDSLAV